MSATKSSWSQKNAIVLFLFALLFIAPDAKSEDLACIDTKDPTARIINDLSIGVAGDINGVEVTLAALSGPDRAYMDNIRLNEAERVNNFLLTVQDAFDKGIHLCIYISKEDWTNALLAYDGKTDNMVPSKDAYIATDPELIRPIRVNVIKGGFVLPAEPSRLQEYIEGILNIEVSTTALLKNVFRIYTFPVKWTWERFSEILK